MVLADTGEKRTHIEVDELVRKKLWLLSSGFIRRIAFCNDFRDLTGNLHQKYVNRNKDMLPISGLEIVQGSYQAHTTALDKEIDFRMGEKIATMNF